MPAKALIYYHRSYRKITGSGWVFVTALSGISLLFSVLILLYSPLITEKMSLVSQTALSPFYSVGTITVIEKPFLWSTVSQVSLPGTSPSRSFAFINLVVSLVLIMFLLRVKKRKNIAIYFMFLAAINLVSSVFFLFSPQAFPYTSTEFSELYIKAQLSMWLFIPFILGMAFLPLPAPMSHKLLLMIFTFVYSAIFGTLRYIIFLYIISRFSVLYMALLFFAFGPLIDFVYIVGIYSFYSSRLAKNLKSSASVWKWSY